MFLLLKQTFVIFSDPVTSKVFGQTEASAYVASPTYLESIVIDFDANIPPTFLLRIEAFDKDASIGSSIVAVNKLFRVAPFSTQKVDWNSS